MKRIKTLLFSIQASGGDLYTCLLVCLVIWLLDLYFSGNDKPKRASEKNPWLRAWMGARGLVQIIKLYRLLKYLAEFL